MTSIQKIAPRDPLFPEYLRQISQPPKALYYISSCWDELLPLPKIAIVGSRKVSTYGRIVTAQFAAELARAGIVIVSGLAYGVDAIAHRAALQAKGRTIAILPTGLDSIHPSTHRLLAHDMLAQGGALVSEYAPGSVPYKGNFVERNRIVSGIADALIVTEAAAKSGTLHTANFALDQGKEVFAIPGNITSATSEGTNNLIKVGATPVTSTQDIFTQLGIAHIQQQKLSSTDPHHQAIIDMLYSGIHDGEELLRRSGISVQQFNQALTMLEIQGAVDALGNNQWSLKK